MVISLQHTNADGHHDSTAAAIAVGGHNTDSVYHIVGHSDWNTCSTGGEWTGAWTDSDGVVDWSPTIIQWGLPLHCEGHTVLTILLNSGEESARRNGDTCKGRDFQQHTRAVKIKKWQVRGITHKPINYNAATDSKSDWMQPNPKFYF